MSQKVSDCPNRDTLLDFISLHLDDRQVNQTEAHVSDCPDCRRKLESLAATDEVWAEAKDSLSSMEIQFASETTFASHFNGGPSNAFTESIHNILGPTDDPNMMGRIGHYEVVGIVGHGGMGVVFKSWDAPLNRFVAIKMLLPHLAVSGAARQRFAREGQAAAAVIDDHVTPIYSVADWQGVPYLVTQYCGGETLQNRIADRGALNIKEVLRIGMQTAKGLAAAHAQGLVHRDVKPSNILLDGPVERAMLTDFGLARAADDASITRTGVISGTPQYMSPEQARGGNVDARSDLFSLGSLLYAMCTGHPPFRAETSYGVIHRIANDSPRPVRELNPEVPAWLCDVIEKLHAKDPAERFESAEEVATLLESYLAHVQDPTRNELPATKPKSVNSDGIGWKIWLSLAAAFFAVLFAGAFLLNELNKGKLTIQCSADDVPVRIMQGDTEVEKLTVSKEGATVRIAAGKYRVEVDGNIDKFSIENESVTLSRGSAEVVKIQMDRPSNPQPSGGVEKALRHFDSLARNPDSIGSTSHPNDQPKMMMDTPRGASVGHKEEPPITNQQDKDSTEMVFRRCQNKLFRKDWDGVLQCLTEDCRDEMIFEYLFGLQLLTSFADDDPVSQQQSLLTKQFLRDLEKEFPGISNASSGLGNNYGKQDPELKEIVERFNSVDPQNRRRARIELARRSCGKYADRIFVSLLAFIESIGAEDWTSNPDAILEDIEIESDRGSAMSKYHAGVDAETTDDVFAHQRISFLKENGTWKIDSLVDSAWEQMRDIAKNVESINAGQEETWLDAMTEFLGEASPVTSRLSPKTPEEVQSEIDRIVAEHKSISNAMVLFQVTSNEDDNPSITKKYKVNLDGDKSRCEIEKSPDLTSKKKSQSLHETNIRNPDMRYREDGGKIQLESPVFVSKPDFTNIPDIRRFGLVSWWPADVNEFAFDEHLTLKDKTDVSVSHKQDNGHKLTIVKFQSNGGSEQGEYWLSAACDNRPVYMKRVGVGTTPESTLTIEQHISWRNFDGTWFPHKIAFDYTYGDSQYKQFALHVQAAMFDSVHFPKETFIQPAPSPKVNEAKTVSESEAFEPLLGTWSLVERQAYPGGTDSKDVLKHFRQYDFTFSKNTTNGGYTAKLVYESSTRRNESSNRVTLNPNSTPREINVFGEGFLIQGVYECEGDTLRIAYNGKPEIARAKSLEVKPDSDPTHTLWIFERKKSGNPDTVD
jgi:serine/threonine protein kinase